MQLKYIERKTTKLSLLWWFKLSYTKPKGYIREWTREIYDDKKRIKWKSRSHSKMEKGHTWLRNLVHTPRMSRTLIANPKMIEL